MKWPWTKRIIKARDGADLAERRLQHAKNEREEAKDLSAKSRSMKEQNGFAEAIRTAMGVK